MRSGSESEKNSWVPGSRLEPRKFFRVPSSGFRKFPGYFRVFPHCFPTRKIMIFPGFSGLEPGTRNSGGNPTYLSTVNELPKVSANCVAFSPTSRVCLVWSSTFLATRITGFIDRKHPTAPTYRNIVYILSELFGN